MVKHTQIICRQIADELFELIWPFCGVGDYKVNYNSWQNTVRLIYEIK